MKQFIWIGFLVFLFYLYDLYSFVPSFFILKTIIISNVLLYARALFACALLCSRALTRIAHSSAVL